MTNTAFYLGETDVTEYYQSWPPHQIALYFIIEKYGQIEGEHHKAWVLDQVVRILLGAPVTVKLAKWSDGQSELRFMTGAPGAAYESWVRSMNSGDETPYNMGVAP